MVTPASADLLTGQNVQFSTNISTNPKNIAWSVNGTAGGDMSVGTIDDNGNYTAPTTQPSAPVMVTATSTSRSAVSASATATVVAPGQVTATANPQVAQYSIAPPVVANVSIQFGTDTTYGLTTWTQMSAGSGASLGMYVAGMKANTMYHMRAALQMPDGSTLLDADHTFTTGGLPTAEIPQITVATPNGLTPQSGVEMLDLLDVGKIPPVTVTDLQGNVIWWYQPGGTSTDIVQPVKPLPNGHFLVTFSPTSSQPLTGTPLPAGTVDVVREIDLAGNTIREISLATLNTRLAAAGFNYTADDIHHDVAVLPNGHWILIVNSTQQFTDITGHPGTNTILGDALVDLDTNLNPVWLWNTFDHLDVNREPYGFPDWTHANAVLYSPTDGNLLLSMRHQSWIIKIDYANGKGAGDVLWHLGYQGDFTLAGGSAPNDWFSTQHGPSISTQTTAGSFGLAVFDNGDFRQYPTGETCASLDEPLCPYYSAPQVLTIDETAMTATLTFLDKLPNFSFYGGNTEVLANGNVEYDLCSIPTTPIATAVYEVTPDSPPETVWQLTVNSLNAYRAYRMPSLYPGVQW
ncbi:MAG: aryl-sulfate sulfotransferase [Candidatus Acidiferrales bacterium]